MEKKRKFFIRIVAICLAVILVLSVLISVLASTVVYAAPTQDDLDKLEQEHERIQQHMEEVRSQINSLEYEEAVAQGKKRILDRQIDLIQAGIENLKAQIEQYGLLIQEKEQEVNAYQQAEAEQLELYKVRIRAMEENGTISYYAIVFGARDFADMLSRMDMVESIMEYDKNLYTKLVSARHDTENAKADLEQTVSNMENTRLQLEEQEKLLIQRVEEASQVISDINLSIEQQRELYNSMSEEEDQIKEDIIAMEKAIEEANRVVVGTGSFSWPTKDSNHVTSGFGPRNTGIPGASTNHKGVDIGAPYGSDVLASDGGTVLTSTYSNSYGYYVTISHGNGYTTLYAHMSKLLVNAGDVVNKGDVLGRCGATGIARGAHIHLEVWDNGTRIDPLQFFDSSTYVK